jgi:hypothetical protein
VFRENCRQAGSNPVAKSLSHELPRKRFSVICAAGWPPIGRSYRKRKTFQELCVVG